ncbi:MAG: hypothetical protein OXF93_16925 [Acidobacteria bacterium]|nr:hypothetical protein [Acidobacteriota bacterium]
MAERIYVMNKEGRLKPLTETLFDTEDLLQELLAAHPELLDGEQIRPGDPRRWLLVTREQGIADAPDSAHRWSVDHLMIDQDSVPTLVEVKRSSNSEIRRSVVGQMLDYAAHATQTLGMPTIRRDFEASHGDDADDVLLEFLQPDADANREATVEEFWDRLAVNLAAKRLRLLFVADRIPNELARVVEFLNEQMPGIEVLAVEIKQFQGVTLRTLVPQVIGRTTASDSLPGNGRSTRRTRLTMEQFLEQLPDQPAVQAARQLLGTAEERGAIVSRRQSSLTISVQTPLRPAPLTVAWLFPSMNTSWGGLKGFTIGQVNWVELPGEAQAKFDELYRRVSRDGFAEEVGNAKAGGSHGWAFDPAVVAQHIDLVRERLGQAIAILQSL